MVHFDVPEWVKRKGQSASSDPLNRGSTFDVGFLVGGCAALYLASRAGDVIPRPPQVHRDFVRPGRANPRMFAWEKHDSQITRMPCSSLILSDDAVGESTKKVTRFA